MKIDLGPITRIEGHLNIRTTVEENRITDARCMGEMFRGFEALLRGRAPLDAQQITQRICGVCWIKAPRYGGHVMEVGAAARVLANTNAWCPPPGTPRPATTGAGRGPWSRP